MTSTPEERLASLAKPLHSLGALEEWASTLCKVQDTLEPLVDPVSVLVFCADHGIKKADAAISPFPSSVTQAVFRALAAGLSGTAVLAKSVGAHLTVVDCGIDGDVQDVRAALGQRIEVIHDKVSLGTADFRHMPAMTQAQLEAAIEVGRRGVAQEISKRGVRVVCIGEVGIGNTTSAAALLTSLTGCDAIDSCGRGTGLDDSGVQHKVSTVRSACEHHSADILAIESPAAKAGETLRRLGGFELAAMVGAYMEAADRHLVAVVDGFISAVASLCAVRMKASCRNSMLFATALAEEPSSKKGGDILARALNARPALCMNLALGECSGAALAVPLLRSAAAMIKEMGTLDEVVALSAL